MVDHITVVFVVSLLPSLPMSKQPRKLYALAVNVCSQYVSTTIHGYTHNFSYLMENLVIFEVNLKVSLVQLKGIGHCQVE
jgi:hypothetical protein